MDRLWLEQREVEDNGLEAVVYRPPNAKPSDTPSCPADDSDLTDLEDGQGDLSLAHAPVETRTPPPPDSTPASATHPDSNLAAIKAKAVLEKKRGKSRKKLRNRRARTQATAADSGRHAKFVDAARPIPAPVFSPANAIHNSHGYTGDHDLKHDFVFLTGTREERLAQLRNAGYQFVDSPESLP